MNDAEIRRLAYAVVYNMLKMQASKIPISLFERGEGNQKFLRCDGVWASEPFVEKAKWMDF